ncbi:hypothetical protein [Aeromicrobium sp. HA]|uniref:hypothetical protein n=1 Tax=Aeromicrobium sp. HA TaxID=3009077 RepID=UPI0022AE6CE3|nr:hypothetical protein [Aeromicrobium sp. HA]
MSERVETRGYWGRARFGGGPGVLLGVCVAVALVVSGGVAAWALAALDGTRREEIIVFAVVALPWIFALTWVVLVDRTSLRDAVDRPDDTIEAQWLQRAQSGAFTDLLLVLGLTLVAGVIVDLDVSLRNGLIALTAFAMGDVVVRMLWLKRRDG